MTESPKWPKLTTLRTKEILTQVDVEAFGIGIDNVDDFNTKGCVLRNISGKLGYITMLDALLEVWIIYTIESDEEIKTYDSLDSLLEDGWAVYSS